jgi:hypothetical protein
MQSCCRPGPPWQYPNAPKAGSVSRIASPQFRRRSEAVHQPPVNPSRKLRRFESFTRHTQAEQPLTRQNLVGGLFVCRPMNVRSGPPRIMVRDKYATKSQRAKRLPARPTHPRSVAWQPRPGRHCTSRRPSGCRLLIHAGQAARPFRRHRVPLGQEPFAVRVGGVWGEMPSTGMRSRRGRRPSLGYLLRARRCLTRTLLTQRSTRAACAAASRRHMD